MFLVTSNVVYFNKISKSMVAGVNISIIYNDIVKFLHFIQLSYVNNSKTSTLCKSNSPQSLHLISSEHYGQCLLNLAKFVATICFI